MKTKVAVLVFMFCIALAGSAAARGGWGNGPGYYQNSRGPGYRYQQLTPESQAKLSAFYSETQDLRKQIIMKQAERLALVQGTNSDPAAVAKVSGELFDLIATMQEKAKAAGLETYVGGPGYGRGMGGGRGMMYGCRLM